MVEVIEQIPAKHATMVMVPKQSPEVNGTPGSEIISYGDFVFPRALNRRFLQKCGVAIQPSESGLTNEEVEDKISRANSGRNMYIRFAGEKPLSVVTDVFQEISPIELVAKTSQAMGVMPVVRYFKDNESLQLNFPMNTRFNGMYLTINTGPYGVYGGSGLNAVSYGIAWYNIICSNWTMFLHKTLREGLGRVVHKGGNGFEEKLPEMLSVTDELEGRIEGSREKRFTFDELDNYLYLYERRGLNKGFTQQIKEENPDGLTVYDLSYRLTELCQGEKISDVTRARVEFIAGEVILCYDSIKQQLLGEPKQIKRRQQHIIDFPVNYISLN